MAQLIVEECPCLTSTYILKGHKKSTLTATPEAIIII